MESIKENYWQKKTTNCTNYTHNPKNFISDKRSHKYRKWDNKLRRGRTYPAPIIITIVTSQYTKSGERRLEELLTLREHLGSSPVFRGVLVTYFFNFLCCVFVNLCLVYSMLLVFLDCPFLIAPSVLSNVY